MVPNIILDGTPPFGTKGTITIAGTAYIIEDEKVTPKWDTGEDRKANGQPNRKRWTRDRYGLELKLQLASSATPYPPPGSTFNYQVKSETSTTPFVVIDTPEERNNETSFIETVTIKCEEVINGITTA